MYGEWLPEAGAMLSRRWDEAVALTAASNGNWVVRAEPVGWRLTPTPESGYPAVRAFTIAGLLRRLAATTTS